MSEYQRYEFMTIDRPLTKKQLDEVNNLSSHIEASSTHAFIEYHWGDFKHDPVKVLHQYFDAFLYWANWGSPRLAFRFPHGVLPSNLLDGYDVGEDVVFTQHADYDTLDIHFGEMESPEILVDYELGSLAPIREELMEGDMRALYIAWLASQGMLFDRYDDEEKNWDEDEYEVEEENEGMPDGHTDETDYEGVPAVPPAFNQLTGAQQALAELLQVPRELLNAVARHSREMMTSNQYDFTALIQKLPETRRIDYLVRLARNEPGLSRLLTVELRKLSGSETETQQTTGEHIPYPILLAESKEIRAKQEREEREKEERARLSHLQDIQEHQDVYWRQIEMAVAKAAGAKYDDAVRLLVDLRDAAEQFQTTQEFYARFNTWVRSYLHRPGLLQRLQQHKFTIPKS
ncbi:MAG TPA: hypothetical protein DHW02_08875 [Ktedonobacter sp.]|nr:hypothetical protein [Ktedonobacter sp.]